MEKSMTAKQWQHIRALWRKGFDTHAIAVHMGCPEHVIYNGMYLLKLKDAK
jgi:hypothetical protein